MTLPNRLKSARMTNATLGSSIDDEQGNCEKALSDILGVPIDADISAALFEVVAAGLKSVYLQDAAADPATNGQLRRNVDKLRYKTSTAVEEIAFVSTAIPAGSVIPFAGLTVPATWLLCDGAAVSRSTYANLLAALVKSSTVTITIASPGVVTWNANGLNNNDPVKFSTTGSLPTGITAGTTYYVTANTGNSFSVSAAPGGAAINTTGSQSGTHTATVAPYGNGDGSTTFNVPDLRGRAAFGRDDMNGSAASRLTNAGSGIYGNSPGQVGGDERLHQHAHAAGGGGDSFVLQNFGQPDTIASGTGVKAFLAGTTASNGAGSGQNMPPTLVLNYIIKT